MDGTLVGAIAALFTATGALLAGWAAFRKAKMEASAEATEVAEFDCNERLLDIVDRHVAWAEEVVRERGGDVPPLPEEIHKRLAPHVRYRMHRPRDEQ